MTESPLSANDPATESKDAPAATPEISGSAAAAPRRVADGWREAFVGLAVVLAGFVFVFWGTVSQMVGTWYVSATFNHGFMIAPISAWLLWERREALEQYAPKPTLYGLIPLLICIAGWIAANAAGINSGKEFAFVGMIQSVVFTLLGWRLVRAMLFPLAFLFFAVPFGDFLIPTLQDVTAAMVVEWLRWIDIPVYLDGVFLTIPTGKFEVAEACSGIRFLIATVALGCLFANMSFRSVTRRTIIVALAIAVPIIANGIRAFGIVYIAHITDHTVAVGVDHIIYGWIFFAIVTVLLLGIGMTFRETDGDNEIYMPREADRLPDPAGPRRGLAVAGTGALCLAVAGAVYADVMIHRGVSVIASPPTPPRQVGGWSAVPAPTIKWQPQYRGTDAQIMTTYRSRGAEVHLYIAYYTHQRQGAELVNSFNTLVEEDVWSRAASGTARANVAGDDMTVRTTRLVRRDAGRVVWHWYWVGGDYTSDRYIAKLREARAKLFGLDQAAAAIVVAADYDDSPADAERHLQDFTAHLDGLAGSLSAIAGR